MNKSHIFLYSIISTSTFFSCSAMEPDNDFGIITIISKTADPLLNAISRRLNVEPNTVQERYKKNLDNFNQNIENFKKVEPSYLSTVDAQKKQLQLDMAKNLEPLKSTIQWVVECLNKEQNPSNKESLGIRFLDTVIDECKANEVLDLETLTAYQKTINKIALFYIEDEYINFYNSSTSAFDEMLNASNLLSASEKTLIATPGLLDLLNKKKAEKKEKKRKNKEALAQLQIEQQEKEAKKQQALAEKAKQEAARLAKEEQQKREEERLAKEKEEQDKQVELARQAQEKTEKQALIEQETMQARIRQEKEEKLKEEVPSCIPIYKNPNISDEKLDSLSNNPTYEHTVTSCSIYNNDENAVVKLKYTDENENETSIEIPISSFIDAEVTIYPLENKNIQLQLTQKILKSIKFYQQKILIEKAEQKKQVNSEKEEVKPRSASFKTKTAYLLTGVTAGIIAYIAYLYHNNQLNDQLSHIAHWINNAMTKIRNFDILTT